jgi:transcription antitermination factor NusB
MQGLYQLDVQGTAVFEFLGAFFIENESDDSVRKLAFELTKGTWDKLSECDEVIIDSTIKWKLSRLSPVDKSILRLAVYQLKYCDDIPPRVVMNEAIELAKEYSSDKSPSFVNGVLDAAFKKIASQSN